MRFVFCPNDQPTTSQRDSNQSGVRREERVNAKSDTWVFSVSYHMSEHMVVDSSTVGIFLST